MLQKLLVLILAVTLVALSAFGAVAAPKMKLRLGHVLDQKSTRHEAAMKFAELVAQKTGGDIVIELFPSSQLGNERDMLEGLQMGTIDAVITGDIISNFYGPLGLFSVPYMFNSLEHLRAVMYGDIGEEIKAGLLKESDIVALEFMERGPREITSNKPVNTVDDIQGLKIRVPEIPVIVESWKAMGANPTPMAFGEVYTALQQKTIDAQENPFVDIASAKLEEVQKFIAMSDHMFGYAMLSISPEVWKKLSDAEKQIFRDAAKEARDYQNGLLVKVDEDLEKYFISKGITFTKPDKSGFIARVKPVHEKYAKRFGQDLYDKIVAVGK
ncbi:MAG: TRAP transporter substrate-binding protein [Deltaproteobacteria bacterium]|nr:TRAP transporter substrate-binding protein [Deltaproteobacteria bacterium]